MRQCGLALVLAALLGALPVASRSQGAPAGPGDPAELEDLLDGADLPDVVGADAATDSASPEAQDLEEATRDILREAASFREHPIDVNRAALSDLLRLPFLDPSAAASVVAARERNGPFASVSDLVPRGVLSPAEMERLKPYLTAGPEDAPEPEGGAEPGASQDSEPPPSRGISWALRLRSSVDEEWEGAAGDIGTAAATYARLRLGVGERLSAGLACEKDAGEESPLDHAAFFALWDVAGDGHGGAFSGGRARHARPGDGTSADPGTDPGTLLSLGVGDFSASWGQGLVMGSGTLASLGSYPRAEDRLGGYDGAGEALARRGLFVEAAKGAARVHAFLASTRLDATLAADGSVSTIRTSGLHCTEGERAGRDALRESLLGARVAFAPARSLEAAASVQHFEFDPALGGGDLERQHFKFRGDALTVCSADARATVGSWRLGAEGARSSEGAVAGLAAAAARVGDADVRLGAGYASRDYWAPLGRGFPGCSGATNGLSGWLHVGYGQGPRWGGWMEAVVSRRPWRSYLLELPDGAVTLAAGADVALGRYGRLVLERRERVSVVEEGESDTTGEKRTRRTTLSLRTRGSPSALLTAVRIESELDGVERGILWALGVRLERDLTPRATVALGATTAVERGDVGTAMAYEPGLPGEFGLRSLNGSGTRWYIRVRAGLLDALGISARLSGGPGRGRVELGMAIDASQGVP